MIHDTLKNFRRYLPLHLRFGRVADFLEKTDLNALADGRVDILPDGEIFANVQTPGTRADEDAPLEFHRRYIDVQIPLSKPERMGWLPLEKAPSGLCYKEENDAALGPGAHSSVVTVVPGEFVIFFPQDVHAPCIGDGSSMHKIIIKVLA